MALIIILSAIPRFRVEGLPKNLDFGVLIWQQSRKKTYEAELQGLFYFDRLYGYRIR